MIDVALDSKNPWIEGIDRRRLQAEGHIRLNLPAADPGSAGQVKTPAPTHAAFLPFAQGNFGTASGKAELYSEALRAQGLHPVAEFIPPAESRHSPQARTFPLELLARKAENFLNTTFSNLPAMQELEESGLLEISAADAGSRGIAEGDTVRVFNRRGDIQLKAKINGAVQTGVVCAKLAWAKLSPGGQNINVLTSQKLTDLGNSATFYSVLVEVELFKPAAMSN
jgi:anaerobic selenocysteine-containing dehydrogenase